MIDEPISMFLAGALFGVLITCVLFVTPFFRALNGWDRARGRIEELEEQLEISRDVDEEDWK